MILAGDIGGTKTLLALYQLIDNQLVLRHEQSFPSTEFDTLERLIERYLAQHSHRITAAGFGIAGPVINNECQATNLPWLIKRENLAAVCHSKNISLLNDLEAAALGMLQLAPEHFLTLNAGTANPGHIAVIAAGTGLGEALLAWDGKQHIPMATEGGHTDFAPQSELEDRLLQWLRQRFPGHVSYERLLSGPGFLNIYQFLRDEEFTTLDDDIRQLDQFDDANARIAERGLSDQDPLCATTVRVFIEIYGAEAGNLALKSLSTGGVMIGGGIAPKLLPAFEKPWFMQRYLAKGRFDKVLRHIPVKLSLEPKAPLLGAAYQAHQSSL